MIKTLNNLNKKINFFSLGLYAKTCYSWKINKSIFFYEVLLYNQLQSSQGVDFLRICLESWEPCFYSFKKVVFFSWPVGLRRWKQLSKIGFKLFPYWFFNLSEIWLFITVCKKNQFYISIHFLKWSFTISEKLEGALFFASFHQWL